MRFSEGRLLVFAKAPVPGRVKTRLIGKYGESGAVMLYKSMLRRTLEFATVIGPHPVQLWCAPNTRHRFFAACRRDYGVELQTQRGNDLGRRMDYALRKTLEKSRYAVLIGSDCASLTPAQLRFALKALTLGWEAVLGPAEDGGYLLIGLRRPCPKLFKGIEWGGPGVLAATRGRLRRAGLNWIELPPGWDMDHPADVKRMKREMRRVTTG
jgi:rSAM/selenodomain-associated transferase 1